LPSQLLGGLLVVAVGGLLAGCAVFGGSASADFNSYQAGLWAQRPVITLDYQVAPDLASVTGRESGVFTPDLRTCELVFRAWPNNPTMAQVGDSLVVTEATVNGRPVTPRTAAAGAPTGAPPTLVQLPLAGCLAPGQSVRFELAFRVVLGADADERIGYSTKSRVAWFGSAFPMLAWIRGQGWAEDAAVTMNGETAASEDFSLDLAVTAPTGVVVQGVGTSVATAPGRSAGTTTHRFRAEAVRDVAVAVGQYQVTTQDIGQVRLHLATPTTGTKAEPSEWIARLRHSVTDLSTLLGPFPYRDFWVSVTPGQSDGTEFPGALQFGDTKTKDLDALVAHEVAHQWFYALVGNNQAEHPWLDESLATYGEAMVGGDAGDYQYANTPDRVVGLMGRPMSYWDDNGGFKRYTQGVYNQGAAVFLQARKDAGAAAFDLALRNYIAANAHRVATPADFAHAFAALPQVLTLLDTAGATPTP
jgi:hypothetical protein